MRTFGVDSVLGSQLMTEIGDVRRFDHKQSLVTFDGVEVPSCQSSAFESKSRHISKHVPPRLRKILFKSCPPSCNAHSLMILYSNSLTAKDGRTNTTTFYMTTRTPRLALPCSFS
ncbi:MAG TPA: IS110 family transposase [Butyricicoccus pullicaecorum]|nr:IS110 family transposase [Butyricicoccus pullicaecorum]